ncbi:MAG: hypothetical protein IPK16_22140 [Anaerolineales bacterium]|nr:hypothetical protein [Anaerolineales bacterium]
MEVEAFFLGHVDSQAIFDVLHRLIDSIGPAEMRCTKSQVSFRRRKAFAWAWMPGQYRRGKNAPLVLTLSFRERNESPRWKSIVEPSSGGYTHHLELYSPDEIDGEVVNWLETAWAQAE